MAGSSVNTSFEQLVGLIARLRDSTSGCPWDRAQDHRSLRPYVLEEAQELVEAVDAGEDELLVEELGDVLLQVLLHSCIASERGAFSIDDVCKHLADKLIRRHPHVFGDAPGDLASVCARWDRIKATEGKPKHKFSHTAMTEARKALDRLPDGFTLDALQPRDAEERAGVRILEHIAELRRDGLDPEIAIRSGITALRRSTDSEASP
jgi:MazG family protein